MVRLRVELLGGFQLLWGGQPLPELLSLRAQQLLARLVLANGEAVSRLWSDVGARGATLPVPEAAEVASALAAVREALGPTFAKLYAARAVLAPTAARSLAQEQAFRQI